MPAGAIVFNWDDRSLSGIGIPGRIGRYQFAMASVGEGDDNLSSFTDRKDFIKYISVFPFSQLKNKWLQGFMFEFGAWFCNVDQRQRRTTVAIGYAFRITATRPGRRYLTPVPTPSARAWSTFFMPGITWSVGPYRLRAVGGFAQAEDGDFTGCSGYQRGPASQLYPYKRGKKRGLIS